MKLSDLLVTSYDLGPIISCNGFLIRETNTKWCRRYSMIRMPQLEGEDKWKISDGSSVYSKSEKDFIYEPMPSSRTDEFIEDTRFISVVDALETMNQYRRTMTELLLSKGFTYWEGIC